MHLRLGRIDSGGVLSGVDVSRAPKEVSALLLLRCLELWAARVLDLKKVRFLCADDLIDLAYRTIGEVLHLFE